MFFFFFFFFQNSLSVMKYQRKNAGPAPDGDGPERLFTS